MNRRGFFKRLLTGAALAVAANYSPSALAKPAAVFKDIGPRLTATEIRRRNEEWGIEQGARVQEVVDRFYGRLIENTKSAAPQAFFMSDRTAQNLQDILGD
jgi:hypothetical protein